MQTSSMLWYCATISQQRRSILTDPDSIVQDTTPLPPPAPTEAEEEAVLESFPLVLPPVTIDYGTHTKVGVRTFINFNFTCLDTCLTTIGDRVLFGPNVSLYSGTHPLDPAVRDGMRGPELGKEISIGDDCWIGGNAIILPGVKVGKGVTVGAGSVVTKVQYLLDSCLLSTDMLIKTLL